MHSTRVASSVIAEVRYDDERTLLEVHFRTGRVYRYLKVPPREYLALITAGSRHELRKIEQLRSLIIEICVSGNGMSTSEPRAGERITAVRVTEDDLTIDLLDGRTMTVPLAWYPRLLHAGEAERNNFRIIGGGFVINWPDLDEYLSSQGLLAGAPAPNAVATSHAS